MANRGLLGRYRFNAGNFRPNDLSHLCGCSCMVSQWRGAMEAGTGDRTPASRRGHDPCGDLRAVTGHRRWLVRTRRCICINSCASSDQGQPASFDWRRRGYLRRTPCDDVRIGSILVNSDHRKVFHCGLFIIRRALQATWGNRRPAKPILPFGKLLIFIDVSGDADGTVGWDRTSDLRIHNPALSISMFRTIC